MPLTSPRFRFVATVILLLVAGGDVAQGQGSPEASLVFERNGEHPFISAAKNTICNDVQFYNSAGVLQIGERDCQLVTPPNCSSEGEVGCKTTTSLKAAQASNLTPGNIKTGAVVGGVSGAYPSAAYPLTGAGPTPDLDSATFDAKIKSNAAFEWFDESGARYTGSGDAEIQAENIAKDISIFGVVGTSTGTPVCGGAGDGCYDDAAAIAFSRAITPLGKDLEYVLASGGFKVWKEVGGNRVLRANGEDEWAMKLNLNGKGRQVTEFAEYTSLEGRKCPANVYVDDANKVTSGNCLYYSIGYAPQSLNSAGTSQTTANAIGLNQWANYNGGAARWYVGNIKTCSDLGMRLPTLFETTTTAVSNSNYPTDATPTFAGQTEGIPSHSGGATWTASALTSQTASYANWMGALNAGGSGYTSAYYVRCVLP